MPACSHRHRDVLRAAAADASDVKDSLSINTLDGADNVFVQGVAGVLQVLVDGAPV